MRTRSIRATLLALAAVLAATVAAGPAAGQEAETFEFTVDRVSLAADPHTVVVHGTYTCGPLDLDVPAGGGTVDLTVNQGPVFGVGFVPITVCDGTAQRYRAEVTTFGDRAYRPGRATGVASGFVSGERDGQLVTQFTSIDGQRVTITRR